MRSQAGSRFRGVTKNNLKWQVKVKKAKLTKYIGSIATEEEAARLYDKYAIIFHGLSVSFYFIHKESF